MGPAIALDQTTGAVTISWYDGRGADGNRLYYTQSVDGGLHFLTNQVPVATTGSSDQIACDGFGAYMGMTTVDGVAHAALGGHPQRTQPDLHCSDQRAASPAERPTERG